MIRPRILEAILNQGYGVLWTDIDIVWLGNPLPLFPRVGNPSVVRTRRLELQVPSAMCWLVFLTTPMFLDFVDDTTSRRSDRTVLQHSRRRLGGGVPRRSFPGRSRRTSPSFPNLGGIFSPCYSNPAQAFRSNEKCPPPGWFSSVEAYKVEQVDVSTFHVTIHHFLRVEYSHGRWRVDR